LAMSRTGVAVAVLAAVMGACSTGSSTQGPSCELGVECSQSQVCMGGIAGCASAYPSNCQCLNGTWQAPCPADLPEAGSACTPEGAGCEYLTSTCGVGCGCQAGSWNCGTVRLGVACSNAVDAGPD
jgi:hypothetical protein